MGGGAALHQINLLEDHDREGHQGHDAADTDHELFNEGFFIAKHLIEDDPNERRFALLHFAGTFRLQVLVG